MKDLPTPEKKPIPSPVKVSPLAGLPDYLKDPKNYDKVQKALLETLACPKPHADPAEMMACSKCSENMVKRRKLMVKFGFKSPAQYMAWKKTHAKIKEMMPLDKYNSLKK